MAYIYICCDDGTDETLDNFDSAPQLIAEIRAARSAADGSVATFHVHGKLQPTTVNVDAGRYEVTAVAVILIAPKDGYTFHPAAEGDR